MTLQIIKLQEWRSQFTTLTVERNNVKMKVKTKGKASYQDIQACADLMINELLMD